MDRLIHMASWGVIYSLFSMIIIYIYRVLLKIRVNRKRIAIRIKTHTFTCFPIADVTIFFILTIVAAVRCNVGSDYYNYYVFFNSVTSRYNSLSEIFSSSIFNGYYALSYIVKLVSNNRYIIFTVVAVIFYYYLFTMIRNESEDYEVSLWCYMYLGFFANSLNIIRQYFAMTFVLMAYFSWKRKKPVFTLLFCCLSIMFHYSAIIAIALFIVATFIEPTKLMGQLIWIVGIISGILLPSFLEIIFKLLSSASGYAKYVSWDRNNQIRLQLAVIGSCIVYSILLKMILDKRTLIKKRHYQKYRELTLLFVGLLINIIGIRMWVLARIGMYFNMMYIFILPTYFKCLDESEYQKKRLFIYSLLFVYSIFISIFLGENEYYSYSTIFNSIPMTIPEYNSLYNFLK